MHASLVFRDTSVLMCQEIAGAQHGFITRNHAGVFLSAMMRSATTVSCLSHVLPNFTCPSCEKSSRDTRHNQMTS